jgi:hypothetical protein
MQSAVSDTPKKKYVRSNICVLCGLSFIQTEISPEGVEIYCKQLMKTKLRLSHERVVMIQRVIEQFVLPEDGTTDGVCIKCYRHVERNPGRFAPLTCSPRVVSPRKVSRFAPLNCYYIIIDEVFFNNFLIIIYLLASCCGFSYYYRFSDIAISSVNPSFI